jgi:ABC-2 type transport system permease protein
MILNQVFHKNNRRTLNPLRHYITIVRGILLKGVGLDVLWIHVLALLGFAVVLLSISVSKFRNQLS